MSYQEHNIKAVLTSSKGTNLGHSKDRIPFQLYIPAEDHQNFDISRFFGQAVEFLS